MHREVLTKAADELFGSLSRFAGYYLAGGTALALQLGHRVSVDFDLFCADDISPSLLAQVQRVFAAGVSPLVNNSDELTITVQGVKVTFLKYPFPVLEPFVVYEQVPLLSVREIAATKAYTIGRRGSLKDYVDLYFVLAEGHASLIDIIEMAEKKYGAEFNSRLFLEQLVYLGDLDDAEVQFLKPLVTPREMLTFFEKTIRTATEQF
jgi:hypothetical protein